MIRCVLHELKSAYFVLDSKWFSHFTNVKCESFTHFEFEKRESYTHFQAEIFDFIHFLFNNLGYRNVKNEQKCNESTNSMEGKFQ